VLKNPSKVACVIALVLLPVVAGAQKPQPPAKAPPSPSRAEQNKRLVLDALEQVFNAHRLDRVDQFFAEDYRQHNPHAGQGRASVKSYFGMLFAAFPDWKGEVEHIIAEGDKVIMVVTWSGTHQGEFMGVKPTGQRVTTRTADVMRIHDGKVAEHWDVVADQDMWEKLGFIRKAEPKH
jgi:steroid delta-isomerase-like uncharacterized protein